MDLNYEAKNLIKFREIYKNNPYLIFPEPYKVSKNFLIMSYESGQNFNKIKISDYKKFKIITLIKLFLRTMLSIENFLHCDFHIGNWSVSEKIINKLNPIIIYDLGLCTELPKNYTEDFLQTIESKNMNNIVNFLLREDSISYNPYKNIDDFNKIKKEIIIEVEETMKIKCLHNITVVDLKSVYPIIFSRGFILNSLCINLIVTLTITTENFINYTENTLEFDDPEITENNKYKTQFPSMISFCKTYDIFPKLSEFLEKQLKEYASKNEFELFNQVEKIENLMDNKIVEKILKVNNMDN